MQRSQHLALYYARFVVFRAPRRLLRVPKFAPIGPPMINLSKIVARDSGNLLKAYPFLGVNGSQFHSSIRLHNLETMPNRPKSAPELPIPPNIQVQVRAGNDKPVKETPMSTTEEAGSKQIAKESQKSIEPKKPKKSLWVKFKNELTHYYHGFRLLGLETRIAGGICFQLMTGKSLSRRERNQLVRTAADIFRLVPFAVFIIVPFMEFLLPVYLKFFPFMLPSTFKEKNKEEEKMRQVLKAKLEMARFLQETVMKTTGSAAKGKDVPTINEFQEFLKTVRQSGQLANTKDIVRFSRLFEDQVTLDSLDHQHLKALCQLLEINSLGPSNLLRFQLWLRVRQLRTEDKLIAKEGVDQIPPWELQSLSRSRGMRSLGLTEQRMRSQLSQWLELHLEKNVPISLLLLSRAMYLQDTTLPPEQQLQKVISVLPEKAAEEAAVKAVESTEDVDPKTKMEVLRKEQETIKAERAAAKKASEEKRREAKDLARKAAAQLKESGKLDEILATQIEATRGPTAHGEELTDKAQVLTMKDPGAPLPEPIVKSKIVPAAVSAFSAAAEGTKAPVPAAPPLAESVTSTATLRPSLEQVRREEDVEPLVSAKDLDSIKDAIKSMDDTNKAMHEEDLQVLKEDLEDAVKLRQLQQAEEAKADEEAKAIEEKGAEAPVQGAITPAVAKEASFDVVQSPQTEVIPEKTVEVAGTPPSMPAVAPTAVAQTPSVEQVTLEAKKEGEEKGESKATKEGQPKQEEEELDEKAKKKAAAKKAAKTQKTVKRIGAQVDRLLGDMDTLMEKLHGQKTNLLKEIQAQEDKAKSLEKDEEKNEIFKVIRTDQQRVVDINDVIVSLQNLQEKASTRKSTDGTTVVADDAERWQRILDALDEDHDGKVELKHLVAVVELLKTQNVELKTSQLSDVVELLEQEQQLEEEQEAVDAAATKASVEEPKKPEMDSKESPPPINSHGTPKSSA